MTSMDHGHPLRRVVVRVDTHKHVHVAGPGSALHRGGIGTVEVLCSLTAAKNVAVKARSAALISLRQVLVDAPDEPREQLEGLSRMALIRRSTALRPGSATNTSRESGPAATVSLGAAVLSMDRVTSSPASNTCHWRICCMSVMPRRCRRA